MLLDDYKKARGKARTAEDTSDLQSEFEQYGRKSHNKKSSNMYVDSSDDETIVDPPPQLKKKQMGNMGM